MKIVILSNTNKFPYHTQITKALNNTASSVLFCAYFVDISNKTPISSISQQLSTECPDVIITLDLAGFELRTLTGESLLNMLPCKVCNIIWGDKPEYSNYLSGKLSLSMLFYDATSNDNQLPSKYPNMRYYYSTSKAIPTVPFNNVNTESDVLETLQNIWNRFTKEVLL